MSSWLVHLQIAENLKDLVKSEDYSAFLVGSIAPDCGDLIEGTDTFYPDKMTTHFYLAPHKSRIRIDEFYDRYCQEYNAFYLGYYIHLCTDMLHSWRIYKPVYKSLNKDKNMIPLIKKDWYDADKLCLNCTVFTDFKKIKEFKNTYLDYYDEEVFNRHIPLIVDYYENYQLENVTLHYYDLNKRSEFIDYVCEKVRENLKDKGYSL